jgi:predicted AAA+ superfamily ATPase
LAIDEVQKIPGWTEAIKKLWDASDREIKLVVTGSSSLLVEKGLKETLAGRFELIRAEHWNYHEAKRIFDLKLHDYIEFGCYPGSIPLLETSVERWGQYVRDSIVEPALGRDLLQLHPVEQPALLRQIFGAVVSLPCQIVSLQKLQGQLQGKGTLPTIQHYLKLLGDAYLISGIEKYSKAPIRAKKSSPKLIIHDNGLIRAFRRPVKDSIDEIALGRYFENLIGARLLEAGWDIFYWKERQQEVDFVALGPKGERWAIEVKTSKTTEKELAGLKKFCELNPDFEPCLLSLIEQKFADIKSLAVEEVLGFHREY